MLTFNFSHRWREKLTIAAACSDPQIRGLLMSMQPQSNVSWRRVQSLPNKMLQPQVVPTKDFIYVGGGLGNSSKLSLCAFAYSIAEDTWKTLPETPAVLFGMCYFQDSLVTVGGLHEDGVTDKVYHLNQKLWKWEEFLPPMLTKRFTLSVFPVNTILIACGGGKWIDVIQDSQPISTVEVYKHETKTWSYAENLPKPGAAMPLTISGKTCYMLRYADGVDGPIYTAEIPCVEGNPESLNGSTFKLDWHTILPPPITNASIVATDSYLLAIGGHTKKGTVKDIHIYIKESQEWMQLVHGALPQEVEGCGLALLETTGEVMVVGGEDSLGKFTDDVFIGKLL
jgi:hypothetical protein